MSTDAKIDDKSLAIIANRFKAEQYGDVMTIVNRALEGKTLNNKERNTLITHISERQFASKPMSMTEMKREILAKIGHPIKEPSSGYGGYKPMVTNTVSRGELALIYDYVVKGVTTKPKKSSDE